MSDMSHHAFSERTAEALFRRRADAYIRELGRGPLSQHEIDEVGRRDLGPLWRGTYAQHRVPLAPGFYIVNTAKTDRSRGVHWVGLVKDGRKDVYVYDSFARSPRHLLHVVAKKVEEAGGEVFSSDRGDKEQATHTAVCGQLCLAWLSVVRDLGLQAALQI